MRTPRSSSKQQGQQQHGRGQTNISQFFPSLTDGNSRDSETASLQHQQQQQQLSPLKDTAEQQQQQRMARGATPPPAAPKSAAAAAAGMNDGSGQQQQQNKRSRGAGGSVQGSSGSSDAGQAAAPAAAAWQQQLAALQQKHQQELEQARQEARCAFVLSWVCYETLLNIMWLIGCRRCAARGVAYCTCRTHVQKATAPLEQKFRCSHASICMQWLHERTVHGRHLTPALQHCLPLLWVFACAHHFSKQGMRGPA
jgi:hypothetical protein